MNKKLKWALLLIDIPLILVAAYVMAGPWLAINGIRNLVARHQDEQLWRFVDFDRLRADLQPQLQERIALGIIEHTGPVQRPMTVGGVTELISAPAVDAIASPRGVATLIRGDALAPASGAGHEDPLARARKEFESPSLFTATVANARGQPVVFEFRRSGLEWKLAGLKLPPP